MSEEPLTAPAGTAAFSCTWTVVARNRRVLKEWQDLVAKAPENASQCFRRLCSNPLERVPGRVFPLRYKRYPGAWEYEVTSGDRVFYIPDPEQKRVMVYYAGKHVHQHRIRPEPKLICETASWGR